MSGQLPRLWHQVAGVSGFTAVAMAAYGAHVLKPKGQDAQFFEDAFRRGNQQHFYCSFLMALAPFMRRPHWVGGLATAGVVLFSGSCYAVALAQDRAYGKGAPFGGFCMMGAWLSLLL